MKRKYVALIFILALIGLIALSVVLLRNKTNLDDKTYSADPAVEKIYQQMLKEDGSIDPYIFDSKSRLDKNDLAALILATQNCQIVSPEVPVFGPTCTPIVALTKYQDKVMRIPDLDIVEMARNLAYHPNENVRLNNVSFLIAGLRLRPDVLFNYLTEQSSSNFDFNVYRVMHSRNVAVMEAFASLRETPEYAQYHERLKNSENPMVRAWVYEEDMTSEQIAASVENSAEGILNVFHSEKVVTPKEAEAVFLLFRNCKFKDDDLSLDGECFAVVPFRQVSEKRMFIQEELNYPELILKMTKHENASVRGIAMSQSFHLYPEQLKQALETETDVKAIAAFVYFSKLFFVNTPELTPFYDQLKNHADPRVQALVGEVPLTAEEFEARLLKLLNCKSNLDSAMNCPEFLEFSAWFKSYNELPIEEKAVIAPVVDKYFKNESPLIRMMTASLGVTMAYAELMPQPFDEYWDYIAENGDNETKMTIFVLFCTYAQMDPEGFGSDMELKARLQKMSETMEPVDKKAAREELLMKTFK